MHEEFNENFTDTDEPDTQNMQINVSGFVDGQRFHAANSIYAGLTDVAPQLPLKDQDKLCNIDNDIQIFSNPLSLPTEPSSRQKQQQNQQTAVILPVPHQDHGDQKPNKTFVYPSDQSLQSIRTIVGANVHSNSYVQPKVLEAADDDLLPQTERSCVDA